MASNPTEPTNIAVAAEQAEAFVNQTGGLPEIDRAAGDLRAALDQTRHEIASAEFSNRFPRRASGYFLTMAPGVHITPMVRRQIEVEGEAGHKRASLEAGLNQIERDLSLMICRLVALRTDLFVSQQEM